MKESYRAGFLQKEYQALLRIAQLEINFGVLSMKSKTEEIKERKLVKFDDDGGDGGGGGERLLERNVS